MEAGGIEPGVQSLDSEGESQFKKSVLPPQLPPLRGRGFPLPNRMEDRPNTSSKTDDGLFKKHTLTPSTIGSGMSSHQVK